MKLLPACKYLAIVLLATKIAASPAPSFATLTEVANGVYVRQGQNGIVFQSTNVANVGAIVGTQCIAIIDSGGSIQEGLALKNAVKNISNTPICFLINTHAHPDHFFGNAAFADIENLRIVGHANMQQSAAAAKGTWLSRLARQQKTEINDQAWVLPKETISDPITLDLGGRRIVVSPVQTAHSFSDLTVFDQKTSILWLSDLLFVGHIPVLAGSIEGWSNILSQFSEHKAKHFIPGHGPAIVSRSDDSLRQNMRYLTDLRKQVLTDLDRGESLYDAQLTAEKQENKQWQLFEQYHARNYARAWAELEWLD